jgi:hypothetical protein
MRLINLKCGSCLTQKRRLVAALQGDLDFATALPHAYIVSFGFIKQATSLPMLKDRLTSLLTRPQNRAVSAASHSPFGLFAGFVLPALLWMPKRFSLASRIKSGIKLLPCTVLSALFMFFAAHLLLFKLYLPNRYTIHIFPIVLSLASGIAFTLILDSVLRRADLSWNSADKTKAVLAFTPNRSVWSRSSACRVRCLHAGIRNPPPGYYAVSRPEADAIVDRFDAGVSPALPGLMKDCAVFESKQFTLVRADCICSKVKIKLN